MTTQFQNIDAGRLPQKLHIKWSMKLEDDDTADRPDERDDGFWPSRDKDAAGYVDPDKFEDEMRKATLRMKAFDNGNWSYVGVVAVADLMIPIGGNSFRLMRLESAGLWGIESDAGDYLNEVYDEQKEDLLYQIKSLGEAIISGDFVQQERGG